MVAAGLPPEHASLLLHAGVAEVEALALADPQRLLVQVNRLRLRLLGPGTLPCHRPPCWAGSGQRAPVARGTDPWPVNARAAGE